MNEFLTACIERQKQLRDGITSPVLTSEHIDLLKTLRDGAVPLAGADLHLAAAVWLPRYAQVILVKSKKLWHFGAQTEHLQITDFGRSYLQQLESTQ